MEELIKTFHIDWKLLIAQLINFGIVVFVLYKFAIKPLTKVMDERTTEIEKSLIDAKKIEENLAQTEKDRQELLTQAKREAQNIIQKSQEEGKKQGEEMVIKAKTEVANVIAGAKEQIAQEKDKMFKEVRAEVVNLTIAATRKILGKVVDKEVDEKLIKDILK